MARQLYIPIRKQVAELVVAWLQDTTERPKNSYKEFVRNTILLTGCKEATIREILSYYDVEIHNDHAIRMKVHV